MVYERGRRQGTPSPLRVFAKAMPDVVLDITEVLRNPMRTGIQRVVRELVRNWPRGRRLRLARFVAGRGLELVPDRVRPLLLETDERARGATVEGVAALIAAECRGCGEALPDGVPILVPELCFTAARWAWYEALHQHDPDAFGMIVFDFIPWLHADVYSAGEAPPAQIACYYNLVAKAKRLAFISAATRDEAMTRIGRAPGPSGPVFPLGADALGLERQRFDDSRNAYVVIGSVCRNKCHDLIFAAFERLWRKGFAGELVFAGRAADNGLAGQLADAAAFPRFRHLAHPTDAVLRDALRGARATIAISRVEGYGLGPVESLHAGIPTIVSSATPSTRGLPPRGQIRIDQPETDAIEAAVGAMAAGDNARRLWAEARRLRLPTWRAFAASVAAWIAPAPRAHSLRGLIHRLRPALG